MAATAMNGAIQSSRAEKPLGQLCTGIGWSHLWSGGFVPGMDDGDVLLEYHIGPAAPDPVRDVGGVAGKGLKCVKITGAPVAPDAVIGVTAYSNKTSRTVAVGEYLVAVET